jgi:L-threonylcarbamoyladenylate synthase
MEHEPEPAEAAKTLNDARRLYSDVLQHVHEGGGHDPVRIYVCRMRDADLVAHIGEPETRIGGEPIADARDRVGSRCTAVTIERPLVRTDVRLRPHIDTPAELRRQVFAEQPPKICADDLVVDEDAAFIDEKSCDLGHMRTAIIHDVKTRLLAADSPGAVEEAAAALARGELVAFPTDTVYGLSAGHEHVRKLYGAKDRPKEKRIPVLLSDIGNLEASAIVTPIARALAQRFWPGPLTIILVAPRRGTLAFRVPDHPLARRLIAASGGGLPVTSANRSGEPDARTAQEVIAQLDGRIALVLDGGTTPGGVSSTVVDCTTDQIKIVRQGAISAAEIDGVLATVA